MNRKQNEINKTNINIVDIKPNISATKNTNDVNILVKR